MNNTQEHTLAASSNRGRYAFDTPDGHDVTTGEPLEIYINNTWIPGHIEHSPKRPGVEGHYALENSGESSGYYFVAHDGAICGLCTGMRVRKG